MIWNLKTTWGWWTMKTKVSSRLIHYLLLLLLFENKIWTFVIMIYLSCDGSIVYWQCNLSQYESIFNYRIDPCNRKTRFGEVIDNEIMRCKSDIYFEQTERTASGDIHSWLIPQRSWDLLDSEYYSTEIKNKKYFEL